ncbi:putative EF-hand domain pair, mitochondrial Rho GTPase [Plasmopara halstedii]
MCRGSGSRSSTIFRSHDTSDQQEFRITLNDFVSVMKTRLVSTDLLEDVRRIFKALDIRAQGFISLRSFQQACEMALPLGKHETLLCAFHEADRDGDGRVTYQDFERMCLLAVQITEMSKPTIL